jgi:hypothetical protein
VCWVRDCGGQFQGVRLRISKPWQSLNSSHTKIWRHSSFKAVKHEAANLNYMRNIHLFMAAIKQIQFWVVLAIGQHGGCSAVHLLQKWKERPQKATATALCAVLITLNPSFHFSLYPTPHENNTDTLFCFRTGELSLFWGYIRLNMQYTSEVMFQWFWSINSEIFKLIWHRCFEYKTANSVTTGQFNVINAWVMRQLLRHVCYAGNSSYSGVYNSIYLPNSQESVLRVHFLAINCTTCSL